MPWAVLGRPKRSEGDPEIGFWKLLSQTGFLGRCFLQSLSCLLFSSITAPAVVFIGAESFFMSRLSFLKLGFKCIESEGISSKKLHLLANEAVGHLKHFSGCVFLAVHLKHHLTHLQLTSSHQVEDLFKRFKGINLCFSILHRASWHQAYQKPLFLLPHHFTKSPKKTELLTKTHPVSERQEALGMV